MGSRSLVLHLALEMIQQKYTPNDIERFFENIQYFWALQPDRMIFRHTIKEDVDSLINSISRTTKVKGSRI